MLGFVGDKQGEVRQAAAYGCGVLGQFAGPAFATVCAQAIPLLVQVIQSPDARSEVNLNPTENAIAAVTKILKYNNSAVNVDEVSFSFPFLKYTYRCVLHSMYIVLIIFN